MEDFTKCDKSQSESMGVSFQRQRFLGRELTLQFLYAAEINNDWSGADTQLADFIELVCDVTPVTNPYLFRKAWKYGRKLIHLCCEHHDELNDIISKAAVNWAMNRMGATERSILRLATCEMMFVETIPDATAINEAVELAKLFGEADSTRFVNGVMESIRRSKDQVILPASSAESESPEEQE